MPLNELLYLSIFWLFNSPAKVVKSQLHCSDRTISEFYKLFRDMIVKIGVTDYDNVDLKNDWEGVDNTNNNDVMQQFQEDQTKDRIVALWRERNARNLWGAFLVALRRVRYLGKEGGFEVKKEETNDLASFASNNGKGSQESMQQPNPAINNVEVTTPVHADMTLQKEPNATATSNQQHQNANHSKLQQHGQKRKQPQTSSFSYAKLKTLKDTATHIINPQHETVATPNNSPSKKRQRQQLPSIPSFMDICCLIPSEEKAIEFLINERIFLHPIDTACTHCGYKGFRAKSKSTPKSIKCNRCNRGRSLMKGTFFEGTRAPLHQILYMALFWLSLSPASMVIDQLRCSSATVTEFSNKFRHLIQRYLEHHHPQGRSMLSNNGDDDNVAARLKPHIPKHARKAQNDDHVYAATWRERNMDNLWRSFLDVLRTVKTVEEDAILLGGGGGKNEPWVDDAKGTACCKYHLRLYRNSEEDVFQMPLQRGELWRGEPQLQQQHQQQQHHQPQLPLPLPLPPPQQQEIVGIYQA